MKLMLALLITLLGTTARAESWCAYPLWVHEWGVHVIGADGDAGPGLPDWFHRSGPQPGTTGSVRNLPADNGVRKLPVLHFYSRGSMGTTIPVGIEVGFSKGPASMWYPQVDTLVPAWQANSPAAAAQRLTLLAQRAQRQQQGKLDSPPPDPTRQLVWSRLDLAPAPTHTPVADDTPWVKRVRAFDSAMWVNGASESERFVFYEAGTRESTPLVLTRGPNWAANRRAYVLTNKGTQPVHDIQLVQREGAVFVVNVPTIPAGKSTTFVLEDNRVAPKDVAAATRGRLSEALVDKGGSAPPAEVRWDMDHCVMMRDPAIPFEKAEGHRLYQQEVDAIIEAWGARFYEQSGTTIVYREDLATLDEVMPLSIYTDMYNYVVLRRAGLALWEKVALP